MKKKERLVRSSRELQTPASKENSECWEELRQAIVAWALKWNTRYDSRDLALAVYMVGDDPFWFDRKQGKRIVDRFRKKATTGRMSSM